MNILNPDDGSELCPTCGSDDIHCSLVAGWWSVECSLCGTKTSGTKTEWTALLVWNTRFAYEKEKG